MKIISKFHDYYDSVTAYGIDKSIIYIRDKKEFEIELKKEKELKLPEVDYGCFTYVFIGFCGKIIPALKFHYEKERTSDKGLLNFKDIVETFCYTYEDAEHYYKRYFKESFTFKERNRQRYKKKFNGKKQIKDFFNFNLKEFEYCFREYNTPVFSIEITGYNIWNYHNVNRVKLIINPILSHCAFFKYKDPATAFQDISQYISGVLGVGEPNTLEISDKHMRNKKGFDELSFKTRKGTKKPRRKK